MVGCVVAGAPVTDASAPDGTAADSGGVPAMHRPRAVSCGAASGGQCTMDSDCPGGAVCQCSGTGLSLSVQTNLCVSAACRVDADCDDAGTGFCSPSPSPDCTGEDSYYCHTSADQCESDSDCTDSPDSQTAMRCLYMSGPMHWACSAVSCP
jgi:hypothetical protein